jgi:hypothetical protein
VLKLKPGRCFAISAFSEAFAMFVRNDIERSRGGITLIEIAVLLVVFVAAAVISIQLLTPVQIGGRRSTCLNNLRGVAIALFNYQVRNGSYPGYMNVLKRTDGRPYVDPATNETLPVSWAVMILPDIDRQGSFDEWCRPPVAEVENSNVTVTNSLYRTLYIEQFMCPSDIPASRNRPLISFIPNSGMPDAPAAILDLREPEGGLPRDWRSNGMFFDRFSEDEQIKADPNTRAPMVHMRDGHIRDPKDMTILVTESVDATEYVIDAKRQSADGWQGVEREIGCIWLPGKTDNSTKPPTMTPPIPSLKINAEPGLGTGRNFNHTRPPSKHPGGVNVAFAGQNVRFLNEKISYFVYCKLMASDDANVAIPGRHKGSTAGPNDAIDPAFRTYRLTDEDVNP